MQAVKNLFAGDEFARELGLQIVSAKDGRATVILDVHPEHCNGLGLCHGAVLFAITDLALAAAANSRGRVAVSLCASINWIANVRSGAHLTATAREISLTHKTGVYAVEVCDENGKTLAAVQGTCYRKIDQVPGFEG